MPHETVDKMEEMIGSYGPHPEPYEKTFASSEAPSGMMARGNYSVRSRVVDDDNNVFADWEWAFKVSLFEKRCSYHVGKQEPVLTLPSPSTSTDRQGLVNACVRTQLDLLSSPVPPLSPTYCNAFLKSVGHLSKDLHSPRPRRRARC